MKPPTGSSNAAKKKLSAIIEAEGSRPENQDEGQRACHWDADGEIINGFCSVSDPSAAGDSSRKRGRSQK